MRLLVPVLIICAVFGLACNQTTTHNSKELKYSGILKDGTGKPFHVPDFIAQAQNGQYIDQNDLKGLVYTVNFFFTSCPDVCPEMNRKVKKIQDQFVDVWDFKSLSFTIDPDFDTMDVLRDYSVKMGVKAGKWYFLRTSQDSVMRLAKQGFLLPIEKLSGKQAYIHSSRIALVTREGFIFGYYDSADESDFKQLNTDIKYLLR